MSSSEPKAKLVALVEKIKEQTDQGKLAWEITVDEGVFQTSLADYSVKISKVHTFVVSISSPSFKISIHNLEGITLEEVTDAQLDGAGIPAMGHYFRVMESIYNSARRSALGVDKALDSILESLERVK